MQFSHVPVMLEPVIRELNIKPDGIYVDGTLGGAGHSSVIASKLTTGLLIGVDRDRDAIEAASGRLAPYGGRVMIVKDEYVNIPEILKAHGIPGVDGILLDLGVSSWQLDAPERGFSYMNDAPLDMRMDREQLRTAADIVNEEDERELTRILREYGEEKFAGAIARRIVARRKLEPIRTTGELVGIVEESIPRKAKLKGGHPAKRTFQALRIALNGELDEISQAVEDLADCLNPGGRFAVITFHSLEDRIVKDGFRTLENPCVCPPDFPVCVCGRKSKGRVLTRKPILPDEEEIRLNPRAKSAKLRVFEKG
jgi:16S rRNA (cytosine1402-N4)-methyltransferase